MKGMINNLYFIQIQNFSSSKDTVKRMKRQTTDWVKIFTNDISDKELLSRIHKKFFKLNSKKTSNLVFKMGKIFEQKLREDIWEAVQHYYPSVN